MKKQKNHLKTLSKRLELRPLEIRDYIAWAEAYSTMLEPQNEWDETNWAESELTPQKFKVLLKHKDTLQKKDKAYSWGVFRRTDGALLGEVELMDISRGLFQNAYLGYRIYNPFWGQGFAAEACKAIIEIAFRVLKLHRLEAGIPVANRRSLRLAKSLGFRKEGLSKRRLFINGEWLDLVIYAATCEDFQLRFRGKT